MAMHLAQITKWIAVSMGGQSNVSIEDFLFDRVPMSEPTADEEREFFQFKPRKKKPQPPPAAES